MLVRLTRKLCGPSGVRNAGELVDLPDVRATSLILAKAAVRPEDSVPAPPSIVTATPNEVREIIAAGGKP